MMGASWISGQARDRQPSPTASTAKRASSAPPTHTAAVPPPVSRRLLFRAPAPPAQSSRALASPAQSVLGEVSEGAVEAPSDALATEVGLNDRLGHLGRARRASRILLS